MLRGTFKAATQRHISMAAGHTAISWQSNCQAGLAMHSTLTFFPHTWRLRLAAGIFIMGIWNDYLYIYILCSCVINKLIAGSPVLGRYWGMKLMEHAGRNHLSGLRSLTASIADLRLICEFRSWFFRRFRSDLTHSFSKAKCELFPTITS